MRIESEKCVGCERCGSYCPVGAIHVAEREDKPGKKRSWIDQDACVECGVCFRANVCKPQAIYLPELKWPRVVRRASSDPMVEHEETGVPGDYRENEQGGWHGENSFKRRRRDRWNRGPSD